MRFSKFEKTGHWRKTLICCHRCERTSMQNYADVRSGGMISPWPDILFLPASSAIRKICLGSYKTFPFAGPKIPQNRLFPQNCPFPHSPAHNFYTLLPIFPGLRTGLPVCAVRSSAACFSALPCPVSVPPGLSPLPARQPSRTAARLFTTAKQDPAAFFPHRSPVFIKFSPICQIPD